MTEDSRAADLAQAEAEIAEAEAAAAAARARAHALRLRQADEVEPDDAQSDAAQSDAAQSDAAQSDAAQSDAAEPADEQSPAPAGDDTGTPENADDAPAEVMPSPERPWWRRRPFTRASWTTVGVGVAVLAICVSAGFSGYFVMHHRAVADRQHRTAEYAAAARQGIITLMSLQFKSAKEDVQRVIDNSTGEFKDNFEESADDFVKVLEQSKVDTETEVKVTAVQSMTDESAVVLVAATTKITNVAGAKQDPRPWRLAVTVTRDGEQLKMSKVEFVV